MAVTGEGFAASWFFNQSWDSQKTRAEAGYGTTEGLLIFNPDRLSVALEHRGGFDIRGDVAAAGILTLTTAELTVVDGDELGRIDFQAPLESSGTDAILIGASIFAEADATFSATVNTTDLVFATGDSEVAAEKMRLDSNGNLGINTAIPASLLEIQGDVAAAGILTLSTAETTIVDGDELGRIDFQAPLETTGTDAILVAASIFAEADATFSSSVNTTDLVFATGDSEAATEKMRLDSLGNLGLGVVAFGTSAVGVIGITADGTIPGSSPAGMIQIFADDSSDGSTNATLALRTEQAVDSDAWTQSHALQIWINGTEYRVGLDAI